MREHSIRIALATVMLAAGAWAAFGQGAASRASGEAPIATVGRLAIPRIEFDEHFARARAAYRQRTGEELPEGVLPTFRRTVLEQMIRARLLMLEAERQGRLVAEADAEAELRRSPFFQEGGTFSSRKLEAARRNDPDAVTRALEDIRLRLSGSRLEERVVREHQPEEAKLRAAIERDLTTATVDVWMLPFDAFDGRGAEPTEREVLAAWRAEVQRSGPVPLAEAAPRIRRNLREARRGGAGDDELRAVYQAMRPELSSPAAKLRYAFLDTTAIRVKEPAAADLDLYYRGHLADYSSFDPAAGEIRQRPFDEVRDDVRARWLGERRVQEARAAAERMIAAWEAGRRDRRAESAAAFVRETPHVILGQRADTSAFGARLGEVLVARDGQPGAGMIDVPGGVLAFLIHDRREEVTPTLEEVRDRVQARLEVRRAEEELDAARALFEADPLAFARDSMLHFSRVIVPFIKPIDVPLTRDEVERYHRENIDRYSQPEAITARHILIAPSGPGDAAEQAARLKAEAVLRRLQAGEDFVAVAREVSDDERTRDSGGFLGSFGRGHLPPALDRAVAELKVGETSGLVRTADGFHIIRCTDYEPMDSLPLVEVYSTVGFDAATAKSQVLTRMRADSLLRLVRTPDDARRIAAENRYAIIANRQPFGTREGDADLRAYFARLEEMRPGEIYPLPVPLRGQGFVISWLDSVTAPRAPVFAQVREEALAEHRRRVGALALEAKRAELDALEREGWALDSLASLFGGLQTFEALRAGDALPTLGGASLLDSLVFGGGGRQALEPGQTSGWVAFPGGLARVRLADVQRPAPAERAARLERDRRKELERNLFYYYEELKRAHPVRIRDAELAAITLPPPTTVDLQ